MRGDGMNCEELQQRLREGRELTTAESLHVDECETCVDVWLTEALEKKPAVSIPADFAMRAAARLPARPARPALTHRPRHWGLATAVAAVTVLLVACFSGPASANSWVSLIFVMLIATEIAGLALWLGPRWTGR